MSAVPSKATDCCIATKRRFGPQADELHRSKNSVCVLCSKNEVASSFGHKNRASVGVKTEAPTREGTFASSRRSNGS
jgi:hypothetical protein